MFGMIYCRKICKYIIQTWMIWVNMISRRICFSVNPYKMQITFDHHPDTLFWHSFWHTIWKYISTIMCIVHIGYVFRHSIWHSFRHMTFLLAFYLASVLIYFLADMLTFSLAYTPTLFLAFYLAFIQTFPLTALRSGASSGLSLRSGPGGGPAVCCSSRLRIWRTRRRTECSDKI